MPIPLVDLKKQYQPLKTEIMNGISHVFEGMHLFLGENVQEFEKEFADFCGVKYGIGVCDGTAALQIILRALDIGAGDEVITVSHTFIATVEAIVLIGAKPVLIDIDPDTCLMDISQIEKNITPQTKAIIPVHLYGQTVDMDPLLEIASRHGLRVIEDACQAHGAEYKGRSAGNLGDAAAFSFYYSKNLGAYGEAGFITTNDTELASKIRMIRDHGSGARYHHEILGFNGRLDEIQAVVLRAKLPHLETWNKLRNQHAVLYNQLLQNSPVRTPDVSPNCKSNFHLYVIKTPQRDELQTYLKEKEIFTGIHYPIPVHLQASMSSLGYHNGDLPITEKVVQEIISLPMYAELSGVDIEIVAKTINQFFNK